MSSVEKRYYGIASAMLATMRTIGQTISMTIVSIIFAFYLGKLAITPESIPLLLKAIKILFLIFGGLCFFGVFLSALRGKSKRS